MGNVIEGECNPELFLLLLQKDVSKFVIRFITIPPKLRERGFDKAYIDFYVGSTGNINLETVNIIMSDGNSRSIAFYIDKNGKFRNNQLMESDLYMILNLPDMIKHENIYEISLLPKI